MIKGSGGPYVLSERDIVVMGSMNKFLKGKMHYRCRRWNILLAEAMQRLHFNKFLNDFNEKIDKSVLEELEIWLKVNNTDCPERINSLAEQYENYLQKTMAGANGKITKFWMIYIYYVNILWFTIPWKLIISLYLVIIFFNYLLFILAPNTITMLSRWFFMC